MVVTCDNVFREAYRESVGEGNRGVYCGNTWGFVDTKVDANEGVLILA